MGFLKNFFAARKEARQMYKLQCKIIGPDIDPRESEKYLKYLMSDRSEQDAALEEYLQLCERAPNTKEVMEYYKIDRADLKKLYDALLVDGLGRWVKGHYCALSTLRYPETLGFLLESQRRGWHRTRTAISLLDYWEEKIPMGGLFALLGMASIRKI